MDEVFHLKAPFQPTGDQPQAIEALMQGIHEGDDAQTLLGVTGSGKTFTMANIIARCNRPTLILEPNKTLASQICTEMRGFFPDDAVEYFVSYTTTTSPRLISRPQIPILRRTVPSTTRLTVCATRPRRRCQNSATSSLWRRCPASTRWATPSTTAAWSSASAPAWKWSGMSCASVW